MKALETGNFPEVDIHPPFREFFQHKACTVRWMLKSITNAASAIVLLGVDVCTEIGIWW